MPAVYYNVTVFSFLDAVYLTHFFSFLLFHPQRQTVHAVLYSYYVKCPCSLYCSYIYTQYIYYLHSGLTGSKIWVSLIVQTNLALFLSFPIGGGHRRGVPSFSSGHCLVAQTKLTHQDKFQPGLKPYIKLFCFHRAKTQTYSLWEIVLFINTGYSDNKIIYVPLVHRLPHCEV